MKLTLQIEITDDIISQSADRLGISATELSNVLRTILSAARRPNAPRAEVPDVRHPFAEQEVLTSAAAGQVGFAGGWVSSIYLERLIGDKVPRNQRRGMMRRLGYVRHPALVDGRLNTVVEPDGGKPKLYVREGHPALALTSAPDIARAYSEAQLSVALPQRS